MTSRFSNVLRAGALLAGIALAPLQARAQATPTVPSDDPSYRDVGELYAAGLVDTIVMGTRPYSRAELWRISRQARRALATRGGNVSIATTWALERLEQRLGTWGIDSTSGATPVRLVDEIAGDATVMNSPTRIISGNGLGEITANLNPIASGHAGVPMFDGATVGVQTAHVLPLGRHLVIVARPRLYTWSASGDPTPHAAARLEQAYGRAVLGPWALTLGRDQEVWGQGREGGALLSTSGPPLDMLRLGTERPLTLPWLLRHVGPTSFEAFVADLGADQNFPHARYVGWRGTVRPWRWFELTIHVTDQMGGEGAPRAPFDQRVADAFPIIDAFIRNSDYAFSNKFAGGDLRFRLPGAYATELYFEESFDDFDARRVWSSLWQDGGHVLGVSSHLSRDGRLSGRFEAHHTGIRYFEHIQFLSGVTEHGAILGDPLGMNGASGLASLEWQRTREAHTTLDLVVERRSGDTYKYFENGPLDAGFRFIRTADFPKEWRARVMLGDDRIASAGAFALQLQGGIEQVKNFGFVSGATKTNFIARVAVRHTLP